MTRRTGTRLAAGLLGLLVLGAASPPEAGAEGPARVGQPGPEIVGGPWINSEPLSLAALRGRVVLVEFWTYG
jgi:hypothetical protein